MTYLGGVKTPPVVLQLLLILQEGKQASLAADFSITQFRHVGRLLMVHGRNSYKRSAALGQFVMHRGMIISTMQVKSSASSRVVVSSKTFLIGLLLFVLLFFFSRQSSPLFSTSPLCLCTRASSWLGTFVFQFVGCFPPLRNVRKADGFSGFYLQVRHHLHHVPRLLLGFGSRRETGDGSALPGALQRPDQGAATAPPPNPPLFTLDRQLKFCIPQGRSLSFKTFLIWVLISIYQGLYEMTPPHTHKYTHLHLSAQSVSQYLGFPASPSFTCGLLFGSKWIFV